MIRNIYLKYEVDTLSNKEVTETRAVGRTATLDYS
jgi:hypothetical protein